jgi:xanthine dehydrogenase small subunit
MYEAPPDKHDWLRQPCGSSQTTTERIARLSDLARGDTLALRHGDHTFFAPRTLDEFAALLMDYQDATILAGGTDIGLWVTKQHRDLSTLIYTGEVAGLSDIDVNETHIEIGAAVTLTEAMPVILEHYPLLDELLRRFASPPIRNAGTLGGNIANGSPIGDSMPALMAAGTSLVLHSLDGSREVDLDDFYHGYQHNDLRQGEFVECIRIPLPGDNVSLYSYKLSKRFDQDISAVCTAYRIELDDDRVKSIRVACGGLAETIRRAVHCEEALRGQAWNEETLSRGMDAFAKDFEPITDMRASADYRLRGGQNLLRRLYLETRGELTDSVYTYGRHS